MGVATELNLVLGSVADCSDLLLERVLLVLGSPLMVAPAVHHRIGAATPDRDDGSDCSHDLIGSWLVAPSNRVDALLGDGLNG